MRTGLRALALVLLCAVRLGAQPFPVLSGDPVDPQTGLAYPMLPGVPLLLPQDDGRYRPPIVDPTRIGDVDLVVRAGHLGIGPMMPPPAAVPPIAVAGGAHVVAGSEVPFTVLVSDGSAGLGIPLAGPEMNGIPVIVAAWADLDGDGRIGPTSGDAQGAADDGRELQESSFLVGRQVAVLSGGVAEGSVAIWRGAPASAGGLRIVLTALAYVGPFSPGFFEGNLPEGPGLATMLPVFPRLDPTRVLDGEGRGGPASSSGRIGVELEGEFDPPVDDPELGTPFALPTDGTSGTIDRAVIHSGPMTRLRFVQSSDPASYPVDHETGVTPGAGGVLYEARTAATVAADGPGNGTAVRLVPVDLLDAVTDPPPGTTATLLASPGLAIAAPDADGDPSQEIVPVTSAAGLDVVLDDVGTGGVDTTLDVVFTGVPVERLAVRVGAGGPGGGGGAVVRGLAIGGAPVALVGRCPATKTLAAVVDGASTVEASLALNDVPVGTLSLAGGPAPADTPLPAGPVFTAPFLLAGGVTGTLVATVTGRDALGVAGAPATLQIPVVAATPPAFGPVGLVPEAVEPRGRRRVVVSARVTDDCGLRRVTVEADNGRGFKSVGRLRDDGRKGDAVAGDGIYGARVRVRAKAPGTTVAIRVSARNRVRGTAHSAATDLQVVP